MDIMPILEVCKPSKCVAIPLSQGNVDPLRTTQKLQSLTWKAVYL